LASFESRHRRISGKSVDSRLFLAGVKRLLVSTRMREEMAAGHSQSLWMPAE